MSKKIEYLILSVVFLVALIIRAYISTVFFGISADEYANIYLARNTFESGFTAYPDQFMWLYYFLSASLLFIVKDAFLATKIVTIFFGSASLIVIYFLTKKIFDRKIAFLSVLLLIIHPEFTLISSIPLREPVYTFFIFLAILFLLNDWIISGAFTIGLSFLTRMEALWINMPAYIVSIFALKRHKKLIFVIALFILTILFMNMIMTEPFEYIKQIAREQAKFHPLGTWNSNNLVERIVLFPIKLVTYLFTIAGLNVIFMIAGLYYLVKILNKNRRALIFSIFLTFNFLFWIIYIFLYKGLVNENYRYIYILIPFIMIFISFGFTIMHRKFVKFQKVILVSFFALFILTSYPIYFICHGRTVLERSAVNKRLTNVSRWVEYNIEPRAANRILVDGVPFFYMYREKTDYNLIKMEMVKDEIKDNPETLLSFLRKNDIKFVVWNWEDWVCREVLPYLRNKEKLKDGNGILVPIMADTDVVVYRYDKK